VETLFNVLPSPEEYHPQIFDRTSKNYKRAQKRTLVKRKESDTPKQNIRKEKSSA